ncbi:Hypothetical predicted protein [Mytilus galloprovincialis]|uniref:Exonuclease domain-containing protein n=1 Tax=Mytilus galloprovincialis TaxID=29158 RepID=A0A8B6F6W1_MYTGA|nr:Hypothetical predicted protein [Mytilus galloprovincialis]
MTFRSRNRGKFTNKVSYFRSSFLKKRNIFKTENSEHEYAKKDDDLDTISMFADIDIGADVIVPSDPSHNDSWKEGRRVIELFELAQNLVCQLCNCPLNLIDTVSERKYGLGSVLTIPCGSCSACNSVETGKRNSNGAFVVNSKAAIGMIHAGMGATHVNNFLAGLNVPPVHSSTIRKKEKEIGKKIQEVAAESCKSVQIKEKDLSNGKVEASFDGGWQKRGTGWQYDSNTGHASMIGLKTGKVMDYAYRSRSCRVCEVHEERKETVSAHDCCRNWKGTSKGMEPDMAVEMTHKLNDSGCQIKVLHADNDSTTTSRLKVHFEDLEKKDDQNHVKKGFSKKLYELSKKYKELKHPDVIPYLVRCFMYAIKENEGSTDDLRKGLNRLVPHVSGDHSLCTDIEWCTYKDDPVNFKYKSLPGGKCLSNDALTSELRELVQQYNRRAESLQNMGSTQANENFNQIVGSKCPKARSYGGSSSFNSRLSAAVLQKNEGYTWLSMVNEASELSPGQFTMKVGETMNKKLERQRENQKTQTFKKRRIEKKKNRKKAQRSSSVKEGTTYQQEVEVNENACDIIQQIPSSLILNFLDFLKLNELPILVGHNITNFDMMVLENRLKEFNMFSAFTASVKGFIDTLKLSKRVFPKADVDNYKQQTLVKKVLGIEYAAHNAKDDVLSLSELFSQKLQSSCEEDDLHHVNFNSCKLSLKPLVDKKIINATVCIKLARSGINVTHLKLANSRDVNGIKLILTDNNVNNRYASSIIGHLSGCEE